MRHDQIFLDTSSLLSINDFFEERGKYLISSISIKQLEEYALIGNKKARRALKIINNYSECFFILITTEDMLEPIKNKNLNIDDNMRVLSAAIYLNNFTYPDEIIYKTNNLYIKEIANLFFGNEMIEMV